MDVKLVLIFDLDSARFGLDAAKVLESVWLPELTLLEEAPPWIVGMFCFRGPIVPVIDLNLRFGRPSRPYRMNDQVVLVESDHVLMGVIVSEVLEVVELRSDAIQPSPEFELPSHPPAHLTSGVTPIGDDLVTLLDIPALIHCSDPLSIDESHQPAMRGDYFSREATPEARTLFHSRAMALRESATPETSNHLGLAVVELHGEFFGVELTAVQEFCGISQLSPIPCCPPHILGAINLRGNLLTLIDPSSALNQPPIAKSAKAIIAPQGEQLIGIAIDEVHDVVYLANEDLHEPPSALCEPGQATIIGTAPYAGRTMMVLDLAALVAREEWIVNETL